MPAFLLLLILAGSFSPAFPQGLSAPQDLHAELVESDSGRYVMLNWERHPGDSISKGFHIYVNVAPDTTFYLYGPAGMVYRQHYYYKVNDLLAREYSFKVRSIASFPVYSQSEYSEPVHILVPSVRLPLITEVTLTSNNETSELTWNYNNSIADLKGFRIKIDDKVVTELDKGANGNFRWVLPPDPGQIIRVAAVSYSGITSKYSKPIFIKDN